MKRQRHKNKYLYLEHHWSVISLVGAVCFVYLVLSYVDRVQQSEWLQNLYQSVAGRIVLQVESEGQALYIDPETVKRHSLGAPEQSFQKIKELAWIISEDELLSLPIAGTYLPGKEQVMKKYAGHFVRLSDSDESWYVFPLDKRRYRITNAADGLAVIEKLGLGISNKNLAAIEIGGL